MPDKDPREREMTVARVRECGRDREVMFFESARIYRLPRENPAFEAALRELQTAAAAGGSVRIRLTAPHGDVIERVTSVS